MSNSSLLDPQDNNINVTPSTMKAESLANKSALKTQNLTSTANEKMFTLSDPADLTNDINAELRQKSVEKLDTPTYRKLINTMASGQASKADLIGYLTTKAGMSPAEAEFAAADVDLKASAVKATRIDPNRGPMSESLGTDLGIAAVQGFQQSIALPVTAAIAKGATTVAKVLPQDMQDSVDNFANEQLQLQNTAIKSWDKEYSPLTQMAQEDKQNLIADFERTAAKEYPNGVARFFAGVLKGAEGFYDNPRLLAVESAKQSSNFLGAGVAGALGKKILTRGMSKEEAKDWLSGEGAKAADKVTGIVGVTYTAAQEGLSNGVDAKLEVLDTKFEDLKKNSPEYNKLLDSGKTPEQARNMLSDNAFDIAFTVSASIGALTSHFLKTGKMEANAFQKTNILESAGREGLEESIQGTGGAFAGNLAEQYTTNPNVDMQQGLGVAAGEGGVLGVTTGGGMSTGAAIADGSMYTANVKPAVQKAAKLTGVKFNSSGNEFSDANYKAVTAGDYSKLVGNDITQKVDSVLDKKTMATFDNDPVKITGHLSKLADIASTEMESALAALPADAPVEDKRNAVLPHLKAMDKLQRMTDSIVKKAQDESTQEPLPADATDEQKAERILSFGSMRKQDDAVFDGLDNLSNSTSLSSEKKVALKALATVKQTLSELRSSGSDKRMQAVAKDVLEGTEEWQGIDNYVSNVLGGMKTNNTGIVNHNLKELARFRDNRKSKFDLASAYVNAKTKEARDLAGTAYMKSFGKSSANLRAREAEGKALVTPSLLAQFKIEADATESAYAGMANVAKATQAARVVEAGVTQPEALPIAAETPTVASDFQSESTVLPEATKATETGTVGYTEAAPDVFAEYTAPVADPVMEQITALDNDRTGTAVEAIQDEPIEPVEEVTRGNVLKTEVSSEKETDTAKKTALTKVETRSKRERITAITDNVDAPAWAKKAIAEKGMTVSISSVNKAEKEIVKNKAKREEREASKQAKEVIAAKVKEFKPKAYETILTALIQVSSQPKAELKALTKLLVDKWKAKLEDPDTTVARLQTAVEEYVKGVRDAATTDNGDGNTSTTYQAGLRMGKRVGASTTVGNFFLSNRLMPTKRPELGNMLQALNKLPVQDYMKAESPLQYVLNYLNANVADGTAELASAKEWLTNYVNTFDATAKLKQPNWDSFTSEGVQMLRKEDGSFPEALKVVFAVESLVALNAMIKLDQSPRSDVAARVGKTEDTITDAGYLALLPMGELMVNVVDNLSRDITASLGVGVTKTTNNTERNNFMQSVGQLALVTLENMDVIQINEVAYADIKTYFTGDVIEDLTDLAHIETSEEASVKEANSDLVTVRFVSLNKANNKVSEFLEIFDNTPVMESLETLFGIDNSAKAPVNTKPTMKDIPTVYMGTNQKIPQEVREAYLNAAQEVWNVKEKVSFMVTDFLSPEQVAVIGGGIQDSASQPKFLRDGIKAKFDTMVAEAKETRKYLTGWLETPMYLLPEAWRVGRTGYKNVLLNPQASKQARHWMGMSGWQREVDMSNPEQAQLFEIALAFNLGIDIDKRNTPTEVSAKLKELTQTEEFQQALNAYNVLKENYDNRNNDDYFSDGSDAVAVSDFMEAMSSKKMKGSSWAKVEAIAEYSAMLKAEGKPFITSIMVEMDGITNGVMIANMLFGIYDAETLAKGGIFLGDSTQDFVNWSKDNTNLDSYKTLAKYTMQQFESIRTLTVGLATTFINGVTTDKASEAALRTALGVKKGFKLSKDAIRNRLVQQKAALTLVGSPYDQEGLITSAWRKLAKDPLMTTNYGAGIKTVVSKLVVQIVETMHVEIGNGDKNRVREIEVSLGAILGKSVYIPSNPLEFTLSKEDLATVTEVLTFAIGNPLEAALENNYIEYNKRKEYLQNVITTHEMIGEAKFMEAINAWRKENSKQPSDWPSKEYVEGLFENLKDYFTVLPTVFSTGIDDGTVPNKVHSVKASKVKQGSKEKSKSYRGTTKSELNTKKNTTRTIRTEFGRIEISSAGVGSLAYIVQGIDGAIAIKLMGKYPVMNAHDGFGFAYDVAVEGAQDANRFFVESIQQHKLWENIRTKHQKILAEIAANPDGDIAEQAEKLGLVGSIDVSKQWEAGLQRIVDNLGVVQQYYFPNGGYYPKGNEELVVTEETLDTTLDSLLNEFNETLENEDTSLGSISNNNTLFAADQNYIVNAMTVMPLFEQFNQMDTVVEDEDHLNHLRKVLSEIVSEVIVPIEMQVASRDVSTEGRYYPDSNLIEMRVAKDSSRINPQQSATSVYTHEVLHPVLEGALSQDSRERTMLDNIFKAVRKAFPNASGMYPDNATVEEKELMDKIYDYVFNNTDATQKGSASNTAGFAIDNTGNNYLSEFVNYALTDRLFIKMMNHPKVLAILNGSERSGYKPTGRSFLATGINNVTEWAIGVMKRLIASLSNSFFGTKGQLPSQMVFTLAARLAGTNVRSVSRLERIMNLTDTGNTKVKKAIIAWVLKPLTQYLNTAKAGSSKIPGVQMASAAYRIYHNRNVPKFKAAMNKVKARVDLAHDGLARSLWRDLKGATAKNARVLQLHAMSNKFVDQLRLNVRNAYVTHLRDLFSTELTTQQKVAMTRVVLRSDLSTLVENGMSIDNVAKLLSESNTLTTTIAEFKQLLRDAYKNNSGYYINMSKSLALKMAGLTSDQYDTPPNAYLIANIAGNTNYVSSGDLIAAEKLIDVLTTLEYLKLQHPSDLSAVANLIRTDKAAFTSIVDLHSKYKLESFKSLFASNKAQMIKGYTKEQFDPNINLVYADVSEEAKLRKEGYEPVGDVVLDKYDVNNKVRMYRSTNAGLATYSAGTISMAGMNAKGADISKVNSQRPDGEGMLRFDQVRRDIIKNEHLKAGIEGYTTSAEFEPVFDERGLVSTYRYMMSQEHKVKLLGLNENFDEVMATSEASKSTKKTSQEVNTKVVEWLWEDFSNNYANEPYEYLEISATSSKPEYREMYAMLPTYMKEEAKGYFKDGKIFVRKDDYAILFGFRKWSVSELGKKQFANTKNKVILDVINTLLRQFNTPTARSIEQAMQELGKMFKDVLVVKSGVTLLGNIISNLVTLALSGVNPVDIVAGHIKGWAEVNKYQKLVEENADLQLKLKGGRNLTNKERQSIIAQVQSNKQRMLLSPVKDLVDEGVYQTITEDIADVDGKYTKASQLADWAAPVTDKIPNVFKDVGDILFMTHNTRLYKALRNATQVSDFAARYVMHQHNLKKGMTTTESISDVVELFVNYDLPTHKGIQYMNDMGFLLFTKYMIRTQKILLKLMRDKPANVLGLLLTQYAFGIDIPDIYDVNLLAEDILMNRLSNPVESLEGVIGIHHLGGSLL